MLIRFHLLKYVMIIFLCVAVACGKPPAVPSQSADGTALIKVQLALNWFPEAEHGGFYAALVHGYYKDAGLDVEILPGGPGASVIPRVATGQVMFGVANADDLLFGRAEGAVVTALLAPLETSPRCIMVHKSSKIESLSDLKNVTLAMSSSKAFAHFLKHKLPLTGVKIVPYPGNVTQFLLDKNYAQQGYVISEPFVAKEKGGDPHVLIVAEEIGFNPYTSLLVVRETEIREHRDLVAGMVRASRLGWEHYLRSPDETNRRIHELNKEMGLPILAYGAEKLMELAGTRTEFGSMSIERWEKLYAQMIEAELLRADSLDPRAVFTNEFLGAR